MNESTRKTMFSSKKQDYGTPKQLFDELDKEFHFNLDVCANEINHKCDNYFTEEINGLKQEWNGTCWMNPPYDSCYEWIEKAYIESLKGSTIVALIPARTDTKYYHKFIKNASEVRFLDGRVKFEGAEGTAPFPSMVVVFEDNNKHIAEHVDYRGRHKERLTKPIYHMINPIRFINE
jgi:phage N-6-adenine-methyltransferase